MAAAAVSAGALWCGTHTQVLHALTALDVSRVLPLPPELCAIVAGYARGVWTALCNRIIEDVVCRFGCKQEQVMRCNSA